MADDAHSHDGEHGEHGGHDPFAPAHMFGHVKDTTYFEFPVVVDRAGQPTLTASKFELPQPLEGKFETIEVQTGNRMLDTVIEPIDGKFTKFMALEVAAALIMAAIFIPFAGHISGGQQARGRFWNMIEAMLLFIRNNVARPAIGHHDADAYLPLLWTLFFFVLVCNLLGLLPWAGSPTGSLAVTGVLALVTFIAVVGSGMKKLGVGGFFVSLVPEMDLPIYMKVFIWPMVFVIEVVGLLIKHFVLAIRLLANMLAGHVVLSVILGFIGIAAAYGVAAYAGVAVVSVLGATALTFLELFVAFLQAYIFAFLSALFIGTAVHPH